MARPSDLVHQVGSDFEEAKEFYDRRNISKSLKHLDDSRRAAVDELKAAVYLYRQIQWFQDRFPEGKIRDVPGLCKVVTRNDIASADWSLTPGRYIGLAPAEVDEEFDFEQTLRDLHLELSELNKEAAFMAEKIQANFEVLGL